MSGHETGESEIGAVDADQLRMDIVSRYMEQLGDPDWLQDRLKGNVAETRQTRANVANELDGVERSLES